MDEQEQHPYVVNNVIQLFNGATTQGGSGSIGNDLTLLSALAYLENFNSLQSFSSASSIVERVCSNTDTDGNHSMIAENPVPGSLVLSRKIARTLISGDHGMKSHVDSSTLNLKRIIDCFFDVGRQTFLHLLQQTQEGRNVSLSSVVSYRGAESSTLSVVLDAVRVGCVDAVSSRNVIDLNSKKVVEDLFEVVKKVTVQEVNKFGATGILNASNVNGIAFTVFPGCLLSYLEAIFVRPDTPYVTQSYATGTALYVSSVAIQRLSYCFEDVADVDKQTLLDISIHIKLLLNTNVPDLEAPIKAIYKLTSTNAANATTLQNWTKNLSQRSMAATDMQVTFDVDEDGVRNRKHTCYAWLAAYLLLLAASMFLVRAEKYKSFFILAGISTALLVLAFLMSWI
jgi:hypothetical protein